jgi:hypothetical protein
MHLSRTAQRRYKRVTAPTANPLPCSALLHVGWHHGPRQLTQPVSDVIRPAGNTEKIPFLHRRLCLAQNLFVLAPHWYGNDSPSPAQQSERMPVVRMASVQHSIRIYTSQQHTLSIGMKTRRMKRSGLALLTMKPQWPGAATLVCIQAAS